MAHPTYISIFSRYSEKFIYSVLGNLRNLKTVFPFFVGSCCGALMSVIFISALHKSQTSFRSDNMLHWTETKELEPHDLELLKKGHGINEAFHIGEDVIAKQISNTVRVLCLILTTKETFKTGAEAVKNTWGPRCNTLLFVSNFEDSSLPVEKLGSTEGKLKGWEIMIAAVKHFYTYYLDSHDWLLRADDDTFVVMENLRQLLSKYNSSDSLYLGCRFRKFIKQGFMSGGSGYVLSRGAVVKMVQEGFPKRFCKIESEGAEDVLMGRCMEKLKVIPVDTRDSLGRGRFFPFSPVTHLIPGAIPEDSWYWNMTYYQPNTGFNCCSDIAISFHYIGHQNMYVMNYLIYHLRPYGINSRRPMNFTNVLFVIK